MAGFLLDYCVIFITVGRMKWLGTVVYVCDKACLTCNHTFTRFINTLSGVSHTQGVQTLAKLSNST